METLGNKALRTEPVSREEAPFLTAKGNFGALAALRKRADMSWTDQLVLLLHVGAEIEHSLMVQYLYAAYSLGGDQVPKEHRPMVSRWRSSILAIAKEEMGHFLTVQNILTFVGSGINLNRQDFPWDTQYYPFDFQLEPLTVDSLCCYIYAEMAPSDGKMRLPGRRMMRRFCGISPQDEARITEIARKHATGGQPHSVGLIYEQIIEIISDKEKVPDSAFREYSYGYQASWDDWGRGYRPDPKLLDAEGNAIAKPQPGIVIPSDLLSPASSREAVMLIDKVATRAQAVAALRALSAQGEALHVGQDETGEPSHFDRFVEIFEEYEHHVVGQDWSPSRNLARNPTAQDSLGEEHKLTYIEDEHTRAWAELCNLRYRMLLKYLSHGYKLMHTSQPGVPSLRGVVMHKVFGEMYNLKALAGILVELPIGGAHEGVFAGPPFEVPYMMGLPPVESDVWHLHHALLQSALDQGEALLGKSEAHDIYLRAQLDVDRQSLAWVERILSGPGQPQVVR